MSTGDATAYIADIARRGSRPLDFVYLDAFDGDDNVPESLCSPGVTATKCTKIVVSACLHVIIVFHLSHANLRYGIRTLAPQTGNSSSAQDMIQHGHMTPSGVALSLL